MSLIILVEVFIKVMNGLVMTLVEDEICTCLAAILLIHEWRCQDIDQVLLHGIIFFVSVFSATVKCVRQNYFHSDW